ncbi:hypothetical protein QJS10_CPA08g00942 [Acorus calamus]|uniref:Uncharacterized protein n=1 Tax=Acorus calamus TaxID=4465 RepID=A0AAV9ED19_ACOCL|nr:hypothetical protein QJS10_CPA08g00942 [Acorus calamus]
MLKIYAADLKEAEQTKKDRWKGLAYDILDDQQDITRGRAWSTRSSRRPPESGLTMSSSARMNTSTKAFENMCDDSLNKI